MFNYWCELQLIRGERLPIPNYWVDGWRSLLECASWDILDSQIPKGSVGQAPKHSATKEPRKYSLFFIERKISSPH